MTPDRRPLPADAKRSDERIPRATLQKRLESILKRIDSTKAFRIEWMEPFLGRKRQASSFEVDAVYVVGSFARGAPLCGDLDVVLTVHLSEGRFLPERGPIVQAVARGLRQVQVHVGTPEKNSSLAKFPDAVLLWSQAARDWRQPLDAIRVDPDAGRFARPTDALPLALRQMRGDLEDAEEVAQGIANGVLASEWWPLDRPALTAPPAWDAETTRRMDLLLKDRGKDSKAILPHVFRYLWEAKRGGEFSISTREPTEFTFGSTLVRFGRPLLDVGPLDALGTTAIVMAPHLTRRRPNGLWILSKGPAHPVHALFAGLTLWAEFEDGHVPLVHVQESNDLWDTHLDVELFSTERKARSFYKQIYDEPTRIAAVSGTRVLDEIGHADIVCVDSRHTLGLTYAGRSYENGPPPPRKIGEIAAAFDPEPLPTCASLATWLHAHKAAPRTRTRKRI